MQNTIGALGELTGEQDQPLASLDSTRYMLKLLADRIVAALALLVLALPLLALAAAVKLDSPGPVFHRQVRVGRRGRRFTMYKLRSMVDGASGQQDALAVSCGQHESPIFKLRQDPRVTRLGRFLRKTSLDELAQLINVAQGHMCLVGPRPPLPGEVERYAPWQRVRLEAVPGMTGLWQVSGRSELSFDEMVRLDREYIEHWSLRLDWKILVRTIPAVTSGRGAF